MRVRFRTGADWVEAETRDIGVGGAFIAVAMQPTVGTTLTIELALPTSDQVFTLPAVVRWRRPGDVSDGDIGGIGVQFVGVDVDVLLELNDYFATLT
jgi:Tfp pilus assembly protein PilZ